MSTSRSILKTLSVAVNAGFVTYGVSALFTDAVCASSPEAKGCSAAYNLLFSGPISLVALFGIGAAHWSLFGNRGTDNNNQADVSHELNESTPLNRV